MKPDSLSLADFYRLIPKVELHYHLLGGVRLATMLDLARKYAVPLTERDAKCYYRAHQAETGEARGGIAALECLYGLMREADDYARVLEEVAEDAHACAVRYLELFWNPSDTVPATADVVAALASAIARVEARFGMRVRLIASINREKSPEAAAAMVREVALLAHPLVIGVGIDYREENASIERFWKAYRLAAAAGLRLTGHCSEFGLHWRNVETGVELIGLDRIDHGYTIVDNPELAARYALEGVPFTVVPSNTWYLRQWPEHAEWRRRHPIRAMGQLGLSIVPATDDWHIHATDAANCYRTLVEDFGFDLDSLRAMLEVSVRASWLPEQDKARLGDAWLAEFDALRARLAFEPDIDEAWRITYRPRFAVSAEGQP